MHGTDGLDDSTPVLVGVGTAFDDVEAVELMVRAARRAADDAGPPEVLRRVGRISVPRGTWSYSDPARIVADAVGADATTVLTDVGIPQQTIINDTLHAIVSGAIDAGLVVGAEARARAARAARRSQAADARGIAEVMRRRTDASAEETVQHDVAPDVHQKPEGEIVAQAEIDAGLWSPVEQYALIESALGAAEGRSLDQHRREIAALWARCNQVAAGNPEAAFPEPMTAEAIATLDERNRPLAFPYGKWHASQWTVDQGAALLFCSARLAREVGIPTEQWVHPLVALDSSSAVPLTRRRDLHRWPAMRVLGDAAAERIGGPLAACAHVELYSCFPAAVRVQQRELDLPRDGTPTITGGMAFAGGPFNSFVLHATAAMARRLRAAPGLGLVTTVSGMLTKPGLAVWSTEPDGRAPLIADLAEPARAATPTAEVVPTHHGPATVAACTVTYDGLEPERVVAVMRTPAGAHVIATTARPSVVARATSTGLVGARAVVAGNELTDVEQEP